MPRYLILARHGLGRHGMLAYHAMSMRKDGNTPIVSVTCTPGMLHTRGFTPSLGGEAGCENGFAFTASKLVGTREIWKMLIC